MRTSCLYCVRKHLAQASILMDESKLGYPFHRWYAVGHLAEAESESLNEFPELAQRIRTMRLEIMHPKLDSNGERVNPEPVFDKIIMECCALAGDAADTVMDVRNSKEI